MNHEQIITIIEQTSPANRSVPNSGGYRANKPERHQTGLLAMSVNAASAAGFFASTLKPDVSRAREVGPGVVSKPYPENSVKSQNFVKFSKTAPAWLSEREAPRDNLPFVVMPASGELAVDPEQRRYSPQAAYTIKAVPWHNGDYVAQRAVSLYQTNQYLSCSDRDGFVEALPRIDERV